MLLPSIVALAYYESEGIYFALTALICCAAGVLMILKKPKNTVFYLKEGCVATALSWIALSIFGCLPFYFSGVIPDFIDALFETVSGFTTTGASILYDVESLPRCMLFWRSFTHWIGGMGILVFLLAILPLSGGSNINLMKAESPGPSVGKLVPKMRYTASYLYIIYLGMTVLQLIFLMIGKMPFLDALMITFGTAGTGGFGINNDSIASYSPYIQWVIIVFMTLFGVNFNAYFLLLNRKIRKALSIEEVRWYFIIIAVSSGIVFYNVFKMQGNAAKSLTDSVFQVTSIITTTGFTTENFDIWPQAAKTVLLMLMITGACAGSTGGGIKVSRIMVLIKSFFNEINSYIHPKSVKKIKADGKPIDNDIVRSTNVYFIIAVLIFAVSFLILSFENNDMVTNISAVLATFNNVGPGLGKDGPTGNFEFFSSFSKLVLIFDMLAGRLELFPMLLIFSPSLWKDTIRQKQNSIKKRIKKS